MHTYLNTQTTKMIFLIFTQTFILILNGKIYWSERKQHRLCDDVLQDSIKFTTINHSQGIKHTQLKSAEDAYLIEAEWSIYASVNLSYLVDDNGLSPGRRQTIIWTNNVILLIWSFGTKFSDIIIEIHIFSFEKRHLNMSSAKCRTFCLGLNGIYHKHIHSFVLL